MTDLEARLQAMASKVTTVNVEALLAQSKTTTTRLPDDKPQPKPSKYRNRKVEINGIKFDSQKEAGRWFVLVEMEQAKSITNLRRQVRYNCVVNGNKVCAYVADFVYEKDGQTVVEDVKSEMTKKLPVYRLKKRLMFACHGIDIVEI